MRSLIAAALTVFLIGCGGGPTLYGSPGDVSPRIVRDGLTRFPLTVALDDSSHVAVFVISDQVTMEFPPVPPEHVRRDRWGRRYQPAVVRFTTEYGAPDSLPDPLEGESSLQLLGIGEHELAPPLRSFPVTRARGTTSCPLPPHVLLVASDRPLALERLDDLRSTRAPRDAEKAAEEILQVIELDDETPGWSAVLQRSASRCDFGTRHRTP